MNEQVLLIRKHLKKKLDPYRYEHTLGVSFTCISLAMRYGYDLDKAELAGLLHDCAKRYEPAVILKKCREREIPMTSAEEQNPALLHAKLGARLASEKYGVEDPEILSAIACHTTGKSGMGLLDQIVYVADYIEPRRSKAKNLSQLRASAFVNLDMTCLMIMEQTLSYLKANGCPIDPTTVAACAAMRRTVKERESKTGNTSEGEATEQKKEEQAVESVERNGKARSRSFGRKKGRKHQNHRH